MRAGSAYVAFWGRAELGAADWLQAEGEAVEGKGLKMHARAVKHASVHTVGDEHVRSDGFTIKLACHSRYCSLLRCSVYTCLGPAPSCSELQMLCRYHQQECKLCEDFKSDRWRTKSPALPLAALPLVSAIAGNDNQSLSCPHNFSLSWCCIAPSAWCQTSMWLL